MKAIINISILRDVCNICHLQRSYFQPLVIPCALAAEQRGWVALFMALSEYNLATLRFVYTSKLRREPLGIAKWFDLLRFDLSNGYCRLLLFLWECRFQGYNTPSAIYAEALSGRTKLGRFLNAFHAVPGEWATCVAHFERKQVFVRPSDSPAVSCLAWFNYSVCLWDLQYWNLYLLPAADKYCATQLFHFLSVLHQIWDYSQDEKQSICKQLFELICSWRWTAWFVRRVISYCQGHYVFHDFRYQFTFRDVEDFDPIEGWWAYRKKDWHKEFDCFLIAFSTLLCSWKGLFAEWGCPSCSEHSVGLYDFRNIMRLPFQLALRRGSQAEFNIKEVSHLSLLVYVESIR